jgi:hypothetical protein
MVNVSEDMAVNLIEDSTGRPNALPSFGRHLRNYTESQTRSLARKESKLNFIVMLITGKLLKGMNE